MDGFGLVRHQKSPLESKIHLFSQSLPGFCTWLRDFPLRTFPLNIVHKYFQETNKLLFGFCLYFVLFFLFFKKKFLDGFSAGNITAVGLFSRLGREGVIVPGFGQFVWVAVDFVVVVFPLHFWQSGEVAGSLFWFF